MDLSVISSDIAHLQSLIDAFADPQIALPQEFTNPELCGIVPTLDVSSQIAFPIPNAENFYRDGGSIISVSKRTTLVMDRSSLQIGKTKTDTIGSDEFTNSILVGSLAEGFLRYSQEQLPITALSVAICRYENVDPRVPRPQTIAVQRLLYPKYGLLSHLDEQEDFYQYRFQITSNIGPRASLYNFGRIAQQQSGAEVVLGWDPIFTMNIVRDVLGTLAELQNKSAFVHGELTIDNIGVGNNGTMHIANFARSQISYEDVIFFRQTYFSNIYQKSVDRMVGRLNDHAYIHPGTSGTDYLRLTETGLLGHYLPDIDTYIFLISLLMLDGMYDTVSNDQVLRSKIWDPLWTDNDSQLVLDRIQLEIRKKSPNNIQTIFPLLAGRKLVANVATNIVSNI